MDKKDKKGISDLITEALNSGAEVKVLKYNKDTGTQTEVPVSEFLEDFDNSKKHTKDNEDNFNVDNPGKDVEKAIDTLINMPTTTLARAIRVILNRAIKEIDTDKERIDFIDTLCELFTTTLSTHREELGMSTLLCIATAIRRKADLEEDNSIPDNCEMTTLLNGGSILDSDGVAETLKHIIENLD